MNTVHESFQDKRQIANDFLRRAAANNSVSTHFSACLHVITIPFLVRLIPQFVSICVGKIMANKYKGKLNFQIELKTCLAKREIAHHEKFSFCHNVVKSRLLQRRQNAFICGKQLTQESMD